MRKKIIIIGGTGAVGLPIAKTLRLQGKEVISLSSKNFDLFKNNLDFSIFDGSNIVLHCAGTFGGLKQYADRSELLNKNYLRNLRLIVSRLEKYSSATLINISSSAVSNKANAYTGSYYFEYTKLKKEIERIFVDSSLRRVLTLRPTNIISTAERVSSSGHVLASLFRNLKSNQTLEYSVWAHKNDWREFTDANDLADYLTRIVERGFFDGPGDCRKIIHCSNGEKVYISEIVEQLSVLIYGRMPKTIVFTEPERPGPLPDLLSNFIGFGDYICFKRRFSESLKDFYDAQF